MTPAAASFPQVDEPRTGDPLIRLRNVEKSYKTGPGRTYVLRRITLDIKEGEFVTIMGPSGAGKSTLLAILGMLDSEWTGEYHLHEQPVHTHAAQEAAGAQQAVHRVRVPAVPPAGRPDGDGEPGRSRSPTGT